MQQSTTPDFNTLRSLFAGLEHHLAIHAVLTGAAQGQVFADFTPDPRWAAVWVQHRVYLAGSANGAAPLIALRDLLTNTIAPAARARGDYAFGLYYAPSWHDHLGDLLPDLPHKALDRQYFVTDQPGLLAPTGGQLSATTRLTAVDASLMAHTELVNHARLAEEMCSERSSVEDFLQRSFGVCLIDGETLAGWCLSEYNCGDRCEVGIEVVEAYQRRGLGVQLTLALCDEAARRGITHVGWHCLADNLPSGATARRAGLRLMCEYPSAVVWLKGE